MTPKERVLAAYPDAVARVDPNWHADRRLTIVADGYVGAEVIGRGRTWAAAWNDAARRIEAAKEVQP